MNRNLKKERYRKQQGLQLGPVKEQIGARYWKVRERGQDFEVGDIAEQVQDPKDGTILVKSPNARMGWWYTIENLEPSTFAAYRRQYKL